MMTFLKIKRSFTLLELLIVISLITVVGGVVTWGIKNYFARSQLVLDKQRLESILRMGRAQAIVAETDWVLEFSFIDGETKLRWHCPEDPEAKNFLPKRSLVRGNRIFFQDKPLSKITFFSSGWVEPLGTIQIGHEKIFLNDLFAISLGTAPSIEEILEKR